MVNRQGKGFTQIGNDILYQVMARPFSGAQLRLLMLIWRLSYGCHRKSVTFEYWSDIQICAIRRQNIKKILNQLVDNHIISLDHDNITMCFNEDYGMWSIGRSEVVSDDVYRKLINLNLNYRKESGYAAYLRSSHWQDVRTIALQKAEYSCQLCNSDKRLNVHHRTYENLGHEEECDVIVLCQECHEKFHENE